MVFSICKRFTSPAITENEKKRIKAEYLKLKNKNYYTIKDK